MTIEFPKESRDLVSRMVYFSAPKWLTYLYATSLGLAYVIVKVHTPISIYPGAAHDDGLLIRLGQSLAEGRWLGGFSQVTLMKGPGYPAFLALANWLGISVSLAHALFHCFAVMFFVAICHRFIKSYLVSGVLLTLLLWHPISLTANLFRVFREEIYYGQTLLVLGTMLWMLFGPLEARARLLWAAIAGAVLGWFWLTREEGLWIAPGLALLLLVAGLYAFRRHRVRELALSLFVVAGVFEATQFGFSAVNRLVYGKFVGVDVKEANFRRALGAIHGVRSGGTKPFVSITHTAMQRVYAVSPAFKSLSSYFDGPGKGWETHGCQFYASACGEMGSGWFMWALRDAVAATGHYASPAEASAFFGRIADQISSACQRGVLECQPQLIPEMPPISWPDVWKSLLPRSADAFNLLLLRSPPLHLNSSLGGEELLEPVLRFLNYPLHTKLPDAPAGLYTLSGWYLKSGGDWISAEVVSPTRTPVSAQFDRHPSPDIQTVFKDPLATDQRFVLRTHCRDDCVLVLRAPTGEVVERKLGEYRMAPLEIEIGKGRVHVDSTTVMSDPRYVATALDRLCAWLRTAILISYSWLFLPVLALGFVAFVASAFTFRARATFNVCFILALVCWGLVLSRIGLLLLIDLTSFPSLDGAYLAPAYYLLVTAAVLSIAAWMQGAANERISVE